MPARSGVGPRRARPRYAAVAGAAAEVAADRLADREVVGSGMAVEQVVHGHDQARRAEPALHRARVDEGLLHVGQRARRSASASTVTMSRSTAAAASTRHEHTSALVEQDRARAALALLAGVLGAGQSEPLAQHVEQALAQPGVVDGVSVTVDPQRVARSTTSCTGPRGHGTDAPAASARRASTPTRSGAGSRRWTGDRRWVGRRAATRLAEASRRCAGRRRPRRVPVDPVGRPTPRPRAPAAAVGPDRAEADPHRAAGPVDRPRATVATAMTMALRVPTLRNSWGPSSTGDVGRRR